MFALPFWLGQCVATSAAACACSCCSLATREVLKTSARVAWSVLFSFSLLLAWGLRDYAKPFLQYIPWIARAGGPPSDAWYGQQAVYRVSLGNFALFAGLAAALWGVRRADAPRARLLHRAAWPLKAAAWGAATAGALALAPVGLVDAYAWLARGVSPLFLALQALVVVDAAQSWNDAWVAEGEAGGARFLWGLLAATAAAYAGAAGIAAAAARAFVYAAPAGADCSFNAAVVVGGLALAAALAMGALHPAVRGSLFPAAASGLYIVYLCYSALASEPRDYACNGLGAAAARAGGGALAGGMALTLGSVVYAALRAGSNAATFSLGGGAAFGGGGGGGGGGGFSAADIAGAQPLLEDDDDSAALTSAGLDGAPAAAAGRPPSGMDMERPAGAPARAPADPAAPPYSYAQFYAVFALASAYIAMLMTGWGSGTPEAKDVVDVGWASVWAKVGAAVGVAALHGWMLAAPLLFPDRDFR